MLSDGVVALDRAMNIVEVNEAARRILRRLPQDKP